MKPPEQDLMMNDEMPDFIGDPLDGEFGDLEGPNDNFGGMDIGGDGGLFDDGLGLGLEMPEIDPLNMGMENEFGAPIPA